MGDRHEPRASEHYPPVGAPDRYDMIVQRGRALRRRRQYTLGAGAGGTVVALALAVAFVTGVGNSNDVVRSELADDGPTTESTTTTVIALEQIAVVIDDGNDPAPIVLTDPEFPVILDAQQCAQITLRDAETGLAVAEGRGCRYADATSNVGHVDVPLRAANGVEIGCATTETRVDEAALAEYTTAEVSTSYSYTIEESLPSGEYELEVSATSGLGDGCAGSEAGTTEVEESAEASAQIELP